MPSSRKNETAVQVPDKEEKSQKECEKEELEELKWLERWDLCFEI